MRYFLTVEGNKKQTTGEDMKKNGRVYEYEEESDGEHNDSDIINMYVVRNLTRDEMQKQIDDVYGVGSIDVRFEEVKG